MFDRLRIALTEALQHPEMVAVGLIALALLLLVLLNRPTVPKRVFRVKGRTFLTPNETEFAERLSQAVEPEHRLLAQVSLGALIEPDLSSAEMAETPGLYLSIRARYSQKVVDFVVATHDFEPRVLIELDDATHDARRDAQRDLITAAAGYPTLRYDSRDKPTVEEIQADLGALLED